MGAETIFLVQVSIVENPNLYHGIGRISVGPVGRIPPELTELE